MIYFKLTNAICGSPLIHHYTLGLNENDNGMFFTDINHIFHYINYGNNLIVATQYEDNKPEYAPEKMSIDENEIPGWKFKKVYVEYMLPLDHDNLRTMLKMVKWEIPECMYRYLFLYDPAMFNEVTQYNPKDAHEFVNKFLGIKI